MASGKGGGGGEEGYGEVGLLLILGFSLVRYVIMQKSTRLGAAINKQSTRLNLQEEEEKENFSLFFAAATIAVGKKVEKAALGEPERWAGYDTGTSARTPSP